MNSSRNHFKLMFIGGGVVLSFLVGCASTPSASPQSEMALMCPTCNTVWVGELKRQGARRRMYQRKPEMTCPTCDKMAKAYFDNGKKILHDCPQCKVTPKVLTPRRPTSHSTHKHQ